MPLRNDRPFPKRARLKSFGYNGTYAYFVTILTKDRNCFFKEYQIVEPVIGFLKESAKKEQFAIEAFCFMSDHLHLLLIGLSDSADLRSMIKLFKQKSGYWFKQSNHSNLWHLSYYDHVLRKDEAIKEIVLYILNNPVRTGIVSEYKEYPFSGSFTMDVTSL